MNCRRFRCHPYSRVVLLCGATFLRAIPGLACWLGLSWSLASAQQPTGSSAPTSVVLDSITVVDVETGRLSVAQRVVIVGDRIRAIGDPRTVAPPAGAQVVNARGKYLIPGLWDMHVHNATPDPDRWAAYLASGVTGLRDMMTVIPLDSVHAWRRAVAVGTTVGPRLVATGPYLTDEGVPLSDTISGPSVGLPPMIGATTPDNGRRAVDWFKAHGADFIKVRGDFARDVYFAIAAEARRVHIPIGGHLPLAVTMAEASDSGQHSIEHVNGFPGPCWRADSAGRSQCGALIARLVRNDTWLTPTLAWGADFSHNSGADAVPVTLPDTSTVQAPDYRTYRPTDTTTNMMVDVRNMGNIQDWLWFIHGLLPFHPLLLAGSDAPLGHGRVADGQRQYTDSERVLKIHSEMELFVAAGLTPLEALQTATLNPAKYLAATDSLGTIAQNKLADLVVLDANPLADIRNTRQITAVIANGRYFDRTVLDALFAAANQRHDLRN